MSNSIILLTDFGLRDAYIGVIKGIIATLNPEANVIDLCHFIEPQNIKHGRAILVDNLNYFPADSVFCCVIDPGVGSSRKPLVIKHKTTLLVGPDNGLLCDFATDGNIWELPTQENISNTFHGRDVFAPWAARLAENRNLLSQFKHLSISDIQRLPFSDVEINSQWQNLDIIYPDHFGNLITNGIYKKGKLEVKLNSNLLDVFENYSKMPTSQIGVIIGSTNRLEISIKNGSAANIVAPISIKVRVL